MNENEREHEDKIASLESEVSKLKLRNAKLSRKGWTRFTIKSFLLAGMLVALACVLVLNTTSAVLLYERNRTDGTIQVIDFRYGIPGVVEFQYRRLKSQPSRLRYKLLFLGD